MPWGARLLGKVRIDPEVILLAKEYSEATGIKMYVIVASALRAALTPRKGKAS